MVELGGILETSKLNLESYSESEMELEFHFEVLCMWDETLLQNKKISYFSVR